MNHHHHFIYSETERRKRQNPEQILKKAGLKKGMCIIDSGSNDGFFTLPAAQIVGETGKVYAIDIDKEALERLKAKLQAEDICHVEIINKSAEEVIIGQNIADFIFFGTVLHDFYDPVRVLNNSRQMIKEGGIIYDFDWQKKAAQFGPPYTLRFSQTYVEKIADKAELTVISSEVVDDNFYAMVFTKMPRN